MKKRLRSATIGKLDLHLVEEKGVFTGVIYAADQTLKSQIEGAVADDVWRRLHDEAAKHNGNYFGFDGARARFLRFFPKGFADERYFEMERNYKVKAKSKLDIGAPVEDAVEGSGLGEAVLSAFRTNLVNHHEIRTLPDFLRGSQADAFVRAAARFTLGGEQSALSDMEGCLKPHGLARWTVVSYLPFLWRPMDHMFLKPEVTKDFAERVGHRFASDYEPRLRVEVYESLQNLAERTREEIADLQPTDGIDVQSFIFVIGGYTEEDIPA